MRRRLIWMLVPLLVAACSSTASDPGTTGTASTATVTSTTTATPTTVAATTSVSPPVPVATTSTTSTSTSTTTSTTSTTTTVPAADARLLGTSVEGRPITAVRRGTPGGTPVVVIGVIHGDEDAGLAITDRLAAAATIVPDGIDLWIVPAMNPDGIANQDRHNAHQVDLNRNFPYRWGPIGEPGNAEYAGAGPASEPETQAIVAFLDEVRPAMVIWYHQDLDRIAPSTGRDGRIRARYAELTGVPLLRITGGTYTGVAATWARQTLDGAIAFIVELGPTLSDEQAGTHAAAVLTVATEL